MMIGKMNNKIIHKQVIKEAIKCMHEFSEYTSTCCNNSTATKAN